MFDSGGQALLTSREPAPLAGVQPVTTTPVVTAVGLDVAIGTVPILRGVQLSLAPGEVVGVTGPNGSGKSTLLRVLATLLRPAGGRLELFGSALRHRQLAQVRRRIGYVAHEHGLHPDLSLRENLHLVARLAERHAGAADEALAAVGLAGAANRGVGACSEGMCRRAELARMLVVGPDLLLLDEAHAALDAASRGLVDQVTADVAGRGGAAVLVTHDPDAVAGIAGRVLHMSQGRLVSKEGG